MGKYAHLNILLAEDDSSIRSAIKAMLFDLGIHKITEAADGEGALQNLIRTPQGYDLIICDWNMPNKNGLELLKDAKMRAPSTPFFMITGRADEESVMKALKSGVSGYLRKPFRMNQLESKIKVIADSWSEMA